MKHNFQRTLINLTKIRKKIKRTIKHRLLPELAEAMRDVVQDKINSVSQEFFKTKTTFTDLSNCDMNDELDLNDVDFSQYNRFSNQESKDNQDTNEIDTFKDYLKELVVDDYQEVIKNLKTVIIDFGEL